MALGHRFAVLIEVGRAEALEDLLQANYDIRTIQALLGHRGVKTTMIYTQTVPNRTLKDAQSPLDLQIDD